MFFEIDHKLIGFMLAQFYIKRELEGHFISDFDDSFHF